VIWLRRFLDAWGHGATQTTMLLGCIVLCALAYSECHAAREDARSISAHQAAQNELLARVVVVSEAQRQFLAEMAGYSRDPLELRWRSALGEHTITVAQQPHESVAQWRQRFADEVTYQQGVFKPRESP